MADQCIVCLEPLDVEVTTAATVSTASATPPAGAGAPAAPQQLLKEDHERLAIEDADALAKATHETSSDIREHHGIHETHENHEHVAKIEVCGHMLHDACLREWTEKANSCPICRQSFHAVAVYDKVGGTSRHPDHRPPILVDAVD